jgi:hypothetical protein
MEYDTMFLSILLTSFIFVMSKIFENRPIQILVHTCNNFDVKEDDAEEGGDDEESESEEEKGGAEAKGDEEEESK